ncbi:hypothetical protein [Stenotrophomonas lactitubi]|uniref:hypothetical protein n=1 Tax=Stenotrophomonas lactitubi TaxID=2045214 RepID=UPI00320B1940
MNQRADDGQLSCLRVDEFNADTLASDGAVTHKYIAVHHPDTRISFNQRAIAKRKTAVVDRYACVAGAILDNDAAACDISCRPYWIRAKGPAQCQAGSSVSSTRLKERIAHQDRAAGSHDGECFGAGQQLQRCLINAPVFGCIARGDGCGFSWAQVAGGGGEGNRYRDCDGHAEATTYSGLHGGTPVGMDHQEENRRRVDGVD